MKNAVIHSKQTGSMFLLVDSFLHHFNSDKADHFADLWKRMTINRFVTQNNYEVLPYGTYYPSMKSAVKKEYVTYVEYTTRAWQLSKDIKQEVVVQKE